MLGAGGVLIAAKNIILTSPVNDLDTGCEIVWERIEIANKKKLCILDHFTEHHQKMTQKSLTS